LETSSRLRMLKVKNKYKMIITAIAAIFTIIAIGGLQAGYGGDYTVVWMSGQTVPHIPVGGSDTMQFAVQNTGSYPGGLTLKFSKNPSNAPLSVMDTSFAIDARQTKTIAVPVSNLGTTVDIDVHITASLWNDNNEHQGNDVTLECILSASGVGDTYLTVIAKNTDGLNVSGINVAITYGTQSASEFTSNGTKTFDLELYTGPVGISTAETESYCAWSGTTQVIAGTNPPFSITLQKKGQPDQFPFVIVIVVMAAVLALVGGAIALQRRKAAKPRASQREG